MNAAATRAKNLLKRDTSTDPESNNLPGVTDSVGFSSRASPPKPEDQRSRTARLSDGVRKAGHAVAHPREAVKSHATSKLAATERPWLTDQTEADETRLNAHDQVDGAEAKLRESSIDPAPTASEQPLQELEDAAEKQYASLGNLEEERKQLHVGWRMSRYVKRARVNHKGAVAFPSRRLYQEHDGHGKYIRTELGTLAWTGTFAAVGNAWVSMIDMSPS